jgi:arsenite methyltransferase
MAASLVEPGRWVFGIDFTEAMISAAQKEAETLMVENVSFHQRPIDALPLETDSVTAVFSNCTINHTPDKRPS